MISNQSHLNYLEDTNVDEVPSVPTELSSIGNIATTKFNLWHDHANLITQTIKMRPQDIFLSDISNFLKSAPVSIKEDPLKWWLNMKFIFPNLYPVAIKNVSTVATSVPSERLFSKAGEILTTKK